MRTYEEDTVEVIQIAEDENHIGKRLSQINNLAGYIYTIRDDNNKIIKIIANNNNAFAIRNNKNKLIDVYTYSELMDNYRDCIILEQIKKDNNMSNIRLNKIRRKINKIKKFNLSGGQNLSLERIITLTISDLNLDEELIDNSSGRYDFNSFVQIFEDYQEEFSKKLSEEDIKNVIEQIQSSLEGMDNNKKDVFLEEVILDGAYYIEEVLGSNYNLSKNKRIKRKVHLSDFNNIKEELLEKLNETDQVRFEYEFTDGVVPTLSGVIFSKNDNSKFEIVYTDSEKVQKEFEKDEPDVDDEGYDDYQEEFIEYLNGTGSFDISNNFSSIDDLVKFLDKEFKMIDFN
jgi:hypothetical protein